MAGHGSDRSEAHKTDRLWRGLDTRFCYLHAGAYTATLLRPHMRSASSSTLGPMPLSQHRTHVMLSVVTFLEHMGGAKLPSWQWPPIDHADAGPNGGDHASTAKPPLSRYLRIHTHAHTHTCLPATDAEEWTVLGAAVASRPACAIFSARILSRFCCASNSDLTFWYRWSNLPPCAHTHTAATR
jgi:hypothetical protein